MRTLQIALGSLVLVSCLVAPPLRAEEVDAGNRAAAQALFDEAVRLRDSGNVAQACPKFAESVRLDPGPGTRFNLADCYERMGRLASAWTHFLEVQAEVERAGQNDRASAVRERVKRLEPRLSRMVIKPQEPVDGLAIERDGVAVGRAQWSTAVPVDAGVHRIQATAPGFHPWSSEQRVQGEGQLVEVVIPTLTEAPELRQPQPGNGDGASSSSPQAPIGWAIGALGVVGIGVGTGFGVAALSKKSDFDAECPDPMNCTAAGLALRDEGQQAGTISTVGFIAGGVLVAAGLVVVLTAPSSDDASSSAATMSLTLKPSTAGAQLSLGGSF